ncbi:MAG: hypothetical protein GY930_02285 [bacterium]|nr:hypothetical protein [bacterium]
MTCGTLAGADEQACTDPTLVGPFTVEVVEVAEATHPVATGHVDPPEEQHPACSTASGAEYFEFTEGEDSLPYAIMALRRYGRGELDILEWDTVFEGGQLVLSEHQVAFDHGGSNGPHLKMIWRERALGQGSAHTVIAETGGVGSWWVLRHGLKSRLAHATVTLQNAAGSPVVTRLGLLQKARMGDCEPGPLVLWNGELGTWEQGYVHVLDLARSASLQWMHPGLQTPRAVIWRAKNSSASLAFELNGAHCLGIQTRDRGPWARPMHETLWRRLDQKWRREAPVRDRGARARAMEAAAPLLDKKIHKVPSRHKM